MKHLFCMAAAALLAAAPIALQAQPADWPNKPIRIIVPAPAGGAYDRTARPLAQEMAVQLKQPVVIDNRPGAGNIIGTQAGASAAADGYTVTMTGMLNTIAQGMYDKVPFNIVDDFVHVASLGGGVQWLVANAQSGPRSFAEMLEQARREPGRLNYASSGQGSTGHLLMELLQRATGTQMTHVPYKGGAPALQDVLAGMVPVTVIPISGAMPHVQSGKLRVLAVSSATRSPEMPQIPTFEELGYKQLTVTSWVGLSVPKGTPGPVVERLFAAIRASLAKPEVMAKLQAEGMTPMLLGPEPFSQLVRSDTERWGNLTRSLHLKAQ